jgi:hypothetical protein
MKAHVHWQSGFFLVKTMVIATDSLLAVATLVDATKIKMILSRRPNCPRWPRQVVKCCCRAKFRQCKHGLWLAPASTLKY